MKSFSFLILFLIFVALSGVSFAGPQTGFGEPPCASWTRADVVFSGKVLKVENAPKSEEMPAGSRKLLFQVLQNFKGADNPTFSVITSKLAATDVKKGETWIVYANNDIVVKSFAIFRSVKIDPKINSDEFDLLKNIIDGKTASAISGQLAADAQGGQYLFEPAEITVESKGKRLTAKTDANGAFNIPVPADGTYKVELKFPFYANLVWNENLLAVSNLPGNPTIFRYEARLNDGDCHFSFFEVSKKTP